MTIVEELLNEAQNFDKGSALRSLLERAANHITAIQPPSARDEAPPPKPQRKSM